MDQYSLQKAPVGPKWFLGVQDFCKNMGNSYYYYYTGQTAPADCAQGTRSVPIITIKQLQYEHCNAGHDEDYAPFKHTLLQQFGMLRLKTD